MQTVLTGIKPTGVPHLGNYLGAIKPAIEKANTTNAKSYFFIADYHALTTVKSAAEMSQYIKEIACTWLACGLDANKTVLYRQSGIPQVFELSTILMNVTPKGLMDRAHAYKAAKQENREVNMGLYTYPVLMSADILAFDTNFVPVGEDQKQHIEIAADIAKSFNAVYGQTLQIPQAQISKTVATIPGLDGRKMSKSYGNTIPLFCTEDELLKCIKRITTDSSAPTDPKSCDHLIFQLYKHFATPDQTREFEKQFKNGIGWGTAKQQLFEMVNESLKPMREKYNYLMQNFDQVEKILQNGAQLAREVAIKTLERVRNAIGINVL